jgi:hypothetical protein
MAILKIKDENGKVTDVPALRGEPGISPHIGENGNWFVGNVDTGVAAGGGSSEEVWEDVCDITTEEAATSIYHDLGASYKKLRIWFSYQFAEQVACNVYIYGNTTISPGNMDRCQIGFDPYGNKTNRTVYTEFTNEVVKRGYDSRVPVYFTENYTANMFDAPTGEMIYKTHLINDPSTGDPYTAGVHSLFIRANTNTEFMAGAKLAVKGVRA